jgi:hypothetical protein
MTNPDEKKPARIKIELPAELEATYANLTLISQSPSEIILDFARVLPNTPTARIYSRVVMTPLNAKLLHKALTDSLEKYEAKYGPISVPDNVSIDPSRGFVK